MRGEHPGIYEVAQGGISIKGEIYEMSDEQHAHLISTEPPDLYESPIELEDGSSVSAMIYPRELIMQRNYPDISNMAVGPRIRRPIPKRRAAAAAGSR